MFNRLDYLKIFCAAAEQQTFKDTAIKLNVSPQVVSRCIKELEKELGEILFARSTRSVKITTYGELFYAQAKNAISIVDDIFQHKFQADNLTVKITAPPIMAKRFILPIIDKINKTNPDIRFDLRLSNFISDVVEDQIDVGIRVGSIITDTRFIARPVSKVDLVVVGHKELVNKHGLPQSIDDLKRLPTTSLFDQTRNHIWPWFFNNKIKFTPQNPVFISDDAESEFQAVLNGMGYGQLPVYLAAPYINSGELIPVLPALSANTPWDLFIYRPQSGPVPPRVRIVYDQFVACFSDPTFFPTNYERTIA